jgi:hypothetical protein
MLFQVGPVGIDTFPLGPEGFNRNSGADLAAKPVMGGLQPREYMGEADQGITITGRVLPTKLGGLPQIDQLHALSSAGTKVPVMRGDGKVLGWYAIESVTEQHKDLTMLGIGFVVAYTLELVKVDTDGALGSAQGGGLVGMLLSLFEVL